MLLDAEKAIEEEKVAQALEDKEKIAEALASANPSSEEVIKAFSQTNEIGKYFYQQQQILSKFTPCYWCRYIIFTKKTRYPYKFLSNKYIKEMTLR
jgi:hypothetical protein